MALNKRLVSRVALLVLAVALMAGCGGKEERKEKYLERGKAYLAEKNYDKARIEFKNVLQIDPKMAEAYLNLGQIYEAEQEWQKAFGNFKKAAELDPALVTPRLKLARMYVAQYGALRARDEQTKAANALGLAKEQVDAVLKIDPKNMEGLALQAAIWAQGGDTDRAVTQLERVLDNDAGLEFAAITLMGIYEQSGRGNEAEQVLLRAIERSDDPIELQRALSRLYIKHKQNDKAGKVLRAIVEANPDQLGYRVSLASFLSQIGRIDEAEQVLRDAIKADPDDAQRYLLLAQFLVSKRDRDTAIAEMKGIIAQRPDLTDLQFGLASLYIGAGKVTEAKRILKRLIADYDVQPDGIKARVELARLILSSEPESPRAQALISEVLAVNPRDNDALLIRGRLAARRKDYVSAINDFRSVLKDQPGSVEVLRLLAAAHQANGDQELARDTLARAVEVAPDNAEIRLSMARLLVQENDLDGALAQVDAVLQRDEGQQQALALKYELLARKGDMKGLERLVRQMQVVAPDEEGGYIGEARLRMAQKDYSAALDILDKVLAKNPDSIAALFSKVDVLVAEKKYREAIPIVESLQRLRPDVADAYFRKARLLQELGDVKGALAQYELALDKAPDNAQVLAALVSLESRQEGNVEGVEKRLKEVLEKNPRHPNANDLLGALYLSQKAFPEAEQAFRKQLEIYPEDGIAYAQLAQVKLAQGDIQGAGEVFEQGLGVLPDSIRLLIGLAGIRERQKDYDAAISLYEKVLERQPGNAVSINNLAALLSDHREDPASLDRAAKLAETLEKAKQVAFLDTAGWVYYRKGDYSKAVGILKAVVDKAPQVPVFHYHLGMAYLKKGDKNLAREHLSKAVGEDAAYDGVEEARSALAGLQPALLKKSDN